ncbi:MAG: tautomerase family protein [Elusimicrobia bacterium]|nr:tautomerase family protein [Elusimicrobiota bacterium]
MPIVRIEMWPGRPAETKKKIAQDVTKSLVDNIGCPAQAVTVVFDDRPQENWAIGGQLQSEMFKK